MIWMNLLAKQKQTHIPRNQTYGYQRGKRKGRDKLGVWDERMHTTIHIKWITCKDLLNSTGSYIQYLVITYNEKEYEREYYVYVFPGILPVRTSEGRTCTNWWGTSPRPQSCPQPLLWTWGLQRTGLEMVQWLLALVLQSMQNIPSNIKEWV